MAFSLNPKLKQIDISNVGCNELAGQFSAEFDPEKLRDGRRYLCP